MKSPSQIIQRLRRIHIENKGLKALSLFLAILLFTLARQPWTEIRISGVPLEFPLDTQNIEISGDIDHKVSVRVRGPRDVVRNLSPNQLTVTARLTNKEPGERVVQLRAEDIDPPENVEVLKIEPSSIKLVLEHKLKRKVKIVPQLAGALHSGYETYFVSVEPEYIEIEGPASLVNAVDFVSTETVNLDGRKESFQIQVAVEAPNNSVRVVTPGLASLSLSVGEARILHTLHDVPIRWPEGMSAGKTNAKFADIELKGPRTAIESLLVSDLLVEPTASEVQGAVETPPLRVRLPQYATKNIEIISVTPKEAKQKRR